MVAYNKRGYSLIMADCPAIITLRPLNREKALAVLKSHLGQLKKQQVEGNSHLKALKSDLDAINRALRQHEVKVTPDVAPQHISA